MVSFKSVSAPMSLMFFADGVTRTLFFVSPRPPDSSPPTATYWFTRGTRRFQACEERHHEPMRGASIGSGSPVASAIWSISKLIPIGYTFTPR
jgi:hypothetical protein